MSNFYFFLYICEIFLIFQISMIFAIREKIIKQKFPVSIQEFVFLKNQIYVIQITFLSFCVF